MGKFIEPGAYAQKNRYILPFKGCWLVTDGGRETAPNGRIRQSHFYMAPCVRWAWDFGVVHPDDRTKCHMGMSRTELLALRFRKGKAEGSPDFEFSESWEAGGAADAWSRLRLILRPSIATAPTSSPRLMGWSYHEWV